ncbi:alpha/beta fold hydrolase [Thalassiella azotivora]
MALSRTRRAAVDSSAVLLDGPWQHRFVAANGARFHVAVAEPHEGTARDGAPLVLLLHGFPQMWWAWRHQLRDLAGAGYRVAAMDLRGFGASDKPPRGYDTMTSAADVAGVVRSLGERDAVLVGHDLGGWIAWSCPALQPRTVRAVAAVSAAHPLQTYRAAADPRQVPSLSYVLGFQVPVLPERRLQDPATVPELLGRWAGPGWPSAHESSLYADAMRVPSVAHSSLEYYRWGVRSLPRRDGRRFVSAVRRRVGVPVLQVHGSADRCTLPGRARTSSRWVAGPYRWELLDGVGHYPAEEAPERLTAVLLDWLDDVTA